MPQTSVSINQDTAIAGMIAKLRPYDIISGVSQEADDGLNFGDPVAIRSFDAKDGVQVYKLNTTASQTNRCDGFVVHDALRPQGIIKNDDPVGIVRKGLVWVSASLFSGAVAAGSQLTYDLSAGKFVQGKLAFDISDKGFKSGAAVAAGDIIFGGLVLWSAVTASEATAGTKLLLLEVNLPSFQAVVEA